MASNRSLNRVRSSPNDELYTRYEDITAELEHYRDVFRGARVHCPCDYAWSMFIRWFADHMVEWDIREVVATCRMEDDHGVMIRMTRDGAPGIETATSLLEGDGDFRSEEVKAIMDRADIVVTNPPFSLGIEFTTALLDWADRSGGRFLFIGNLNMVTCRGVLRSIIDGRLSLGNTRPKHFLRPDRSIQTLNMVRWYTNMLDHVTRTPIEGVCVCTDDYPRYDGTDDCIECGRVDNIPRGFDGIMGVPVTFLDVWCPDQFEVVGKFDFAMGDPLNLCKPIVGGVSKYKRIAVRWHG